MDNLPELAFEKVLSYLSLEDRLKLRAVSRGWQWMIDHSEVKSLCCSSRPPGFIVGKKRLIVGSFTQNFISSTKADLFFSTYGQSILSDLKLDASRLRNLQFSDVWVNCDQSQELFDRLPDHSAVQQLQLFIDGLSNLEFLSRMNQLVSLYVFCSIDAELIRKLFKELPFLINLEFTYNDKEFRIQITDDSAWIHPKRFTVCVDLEWTDLPDLKAMIQFIFGTDSG